MGKIFVAERLAALEADVAALSGGGAALTVKDEGVTLSAAVVSLDFVGAEVAATGTTAVTVTIPAVTTISGNAGTATALSAGADRTKLDGITAGAAPLTVKDEGVNLSTAVTSIDFVGGEVTATGTTGVTVTIPTVATISGLAGTATALATPRKIDGVAFDGSAAIETSWSLARKPASAHAYDDEFETTNLSGNWTVGGSQVATAIDVYAAFSNANEWRYSHNSLRPSWMLFQPSSAASINALHKPVTVPTDWFVWARLSFSHRNTGTITNNDHSIMIGLSATSASAPDSSNYVGLWVMETDSNQKSIQWDKAVGGVLTQTSLNVTNAAMFSGQYVGIQKLSNNYYFWLADESGTWFYLGTHSAAITPDRVFVSMVNSSSTTPGCMVLGIDFLRFSATSGWLP